MSQLTDISCNPGAYTNVGTGPLILNTVDGSAVFVIAQASQPMAGAIGTVVAKTPYPTSGATAVWARPVGAAAVVLQTQPVASESLASSTVTANIGGTGGLALDSSIQTLIGTLGTAASVAGTVWFDPTSIPVKYYIRRELTTSTPGTYSVTWENLDGSVAVPNLANLSAVSNSENIENQNVTWVAVAPGNNYASGDILINCFGVDTATTVPTLAYNFWFNAGPSYTGIVNTPGSTTIASQVNNVNPVTLSSANSTILQLAAGGSFVGSIEPVPGNSTTLNVEILSDVNLTFVVNQYISASDYIPVQTNTFYVLAGVGFNRALGINGDYVNTTLTNTSTVSSTKLKSIIGYCQINPVGQAPMGMSAPVVIASDQTAIPTYLTGSPGGDFSGINILEQLVDSNGSISLNVVNKNPPKLDVYGAQIASDAPPATLWINGAVGPGPLIDTTGYNSIAVSFTAASGTYLFQTSNDPEQFTPALANSAGWPTNGAASTTTSVGVSAGLTYMFPVTGRYFRIYCSAAGTVGPIVFQLRSAEAVFVPTTTQVTGAVTAAGTVAVGAAYSAAPLPGGGADWTGLVRRIQTDLQGNTVTAGMLAQGYQIAQNNYTYSGYTTAQVTFTQAQSTINPIIIGGTDQSNAVRRALTNHEGAQSVIGGHSTPGRISLEERLDDLVTAQRVTNHYLYELLVNLTNNFTTVAEPDVLHAEYTNASNQFSNIVN